MGVVARSPVVGIVAGRAAQTALAIGIAGGHRQPDPLKPDDPGIVGANRRPGDHPGQAMAFAAQVDLDPGLGAVVPHPHRQSVPAESRRLDMGTPRAVAALAGDVGDQGRRLEPISRQRRCQSGVALEAFLELLRSHRPSRGHVVRLELVALRSLLTRRDRDRWAIGEVRQAMLEARGTESGNITGPERDERDAVLARAEAIVERDSSRSGRLRCSRRPIGRP